MPVVQTNNRFDCLDITATHEKLPTGNYSLCLDRNTNEFYLTKHQGFVLPPKVYGKHEIVNRWLKSFKHNSHKNMGIILSGVKGGGKTITAQKLCIESNMPVIIINEPFEGVKFIDFLTNPMLGECIIFIDEFEKVFDQNSYHDKNKARDLLTIMDGTYQTKLIFLLTVNKYELNDYFINRLNRVKYRKDYIDLEQEVIDEVIEDILINKDHRDSIKTFFKKVNMCTFDLLVNLIKEMNLFNEDALEVSKHLNLRSEPKTYKVNELYEGKEYNCRNVSMSPDLKEIDISRYDTYYLPEDKNNENNEDITIKLSEAVVTRISSLSFSIKYQEFEFLFTEITQLGLVF